MSHAPLWVHMDLNDSPIPKTTTILTFPVPSYGPVARLRLLLSGKALRLRGRIARSCLGVIGIKHSYRVPLVLVESDLGSDYALTFVIYLTEDYWSLLGEIGSLYIINLRD